jgi:hypothetical protein
MNNMHFSIINSKLFISVFDNMKHFSEQSKIKIHPNGLHLQSIDDANVSIIDIHFKKEYFEDYNVNKEQIYDFNLTDICKILKICSKSRIIHLLFDNTTLKISATCSENDIKKNFEINSIITKDTFLDLQKLRSTNLNNITIDSKNLQNIFNELFIFSDDACIELKDKSILFYTTNDTICTKYDITIDKITNTTILSKYSLNYLSKFKLCSLFENTELKFNSNTPLILTNKNEFIESNFILSPKIMDID